ncbi:B12-binding domain-containing radical SAM protein [Actinocrinis sp.]|uniref:B12-binding domain-containing radical SAM protein n=1 Tax=Actinocrinis sp. TaxID=1920516 RepID=UPI002D1E1249|nr:radical SAM protein [Actinocrinis sp.]HXR72536.1 radical SAM protein [Actinocrinis sp.]
MRILVTWPPQVPSYFNAGHHLPVFSIAAYLRAKGHTVDALDAGALNCSWKEFADQVFQGGYQAVVLVNEYDAVEGVRRAADYCRQLAPDALTVTVGRLSYQNPGFFRTLELDAVVAGGDYEAGVQAALEWAERGRPDGARAPGVWLRGADGWSEPGGPGIWLPAESWVLPDVGEIPYAAYESLYKNDDNRFCGIPQRRELVVPVARGCPVGCDFCDVPPMQGLRERRMTAQRAVDYIRDSFADHPFEYVAFYAPTFTLDRRWVRELCRLLSAEPRRYPWKCATTLHHLDEDLVRTMAAGGCVRISVGVETFDVDAAGQLPRVKRQGQTRFEQVLGWCRSAGIELNCFVIVGLPGTTPAGTARTIEAIDAAGARVRPTVYTPYHLMRPEMTEREISGFNRQTFVDPDEIRAAGFAPGDFLQHVFGGSGYVTPSPQRVGSIVTAPGEDDAESGRTTRDEAAAPILASAR